MILLQNLLVNGGWRVKNPIIVLHLPMNVLFLPGSAPLWHQFSPQLSSPGLRHSLALFLVMGGALLGGLAWRRWRHNEYAMRLDSQLCYTRFIFALSLFLVVVAVLLGIMLWG